MLMTVYAIFSCLLVLFALSAIPYAFWVKSDCVYFQLIDLQGRPIPNQKIYAIYDQAAYANTFAGTYGGQPFYQRTAFGSFTGMRAIGKTNKDGIFKKRIIFLSYWGLCIQIDGREVIAFMHLFAQKKVFASTPKDFVFDTDRNVADPIWFTDPSDPNYQEVLKAQEFIQNLNTQQSKIQKP